MPPWERPRAVNTGRPPDDERGIQVWHPPRPTLGAAHHPDAFPRHDLPRREPAPPPPPPRESAPFAGRTTHAADYVAHPLPPRRPAGEPRQQKGLPPPAPFDHQSSHKIDYPAHPVEAGFSPQRDRVLRPLKPQARFSATAGYAENYPAHPVQPRPTVASPPPPVSPPFSGTSTARDHYPAHPIPMPPPPPPRDAAAPRPRFDHETSHRADYRAPPPAEPRLPPLPNAPRPLARFSGTTEYAARFTAHPTSPVLLPRPPAHPQASSPSSGPANPRRVPFTATTTNREHFKGFRVDRGRRPLGVVVVNGGFYEMIPPTAGLPAKRTVLFTTVTDGQTKIGIVVVEEDPRARPADGADGAAPASPRCRRVGSFELVDLAPEPCGRPQIAVTFSLSESLKLHVAAEDTRSGAAVDIAVDRDANADAFGEQSPPRVRPPHPPPAPVSPPYADAAADPPAPVSPAAPPPAS